MITALCIDKLLPAAQYGGVPGSTEEEYNSLRWEDQRSKPTWNEIQSAWILVQKNLESNIFKEQLNATDAKLPRALEDIIDVLITKNTFRKNEMPAAVQELYDLKKELRSKILP